MKLSPTHTRLLFALPVVFIRFAAASPAKATIDQVTFDNVLFTDATTLTGYYDLDTSTNSITNYDIFTQADSGLGFVAVNYTPSNPTPGDGLSFTPTTLTTGSSLTGFETQESGDIQRNIASGTITVNAAPAPEASSFVGMSIGVVGMAAFLLAMRKRRLNAGL
jgi:hypothetical protein